MAIYGTYLYVYFCRHISFIYNQRDNKLIKYLFLCKSDKCFKIFRYYFNRAKKQWRYARICHEDRGFLGSIVKSSNWRLRGMSRRKACESYVKHFLMTPSDNCCSVNIGSTMCTSVLSILCGSSLGLTPRYLTNHGSGKKTSCCCTKYLFHFALGIINPPIGN